MTPGRHGCHAGVGVILKAHHFGLAVHRGAWWRSRRPSPSWAATRTDEDKHSNGEIPKHSAGGLQKSDC